jgi:hypothetical protein
VAGVHVGEMAAECLHRPAFTISKVRTSVPRRSQTQLVRKDVHNGGKSMPLDDLGSTI